MDLWWVKKYYYDVHCEYFIVNVLVIRNILETHWDLWQYVMLFINGLYTYKCCTLLMFLDLNAMTKVVSCLNYHFYNIWNIFFMKPFPLNAIIVNCSGYIWKHLPNLKFLRMTPKNTLFAFINTCHFEIWYIYNYMTWIYVTFPLMLSSLVWIE